MKSTLADAPIGRQMRITHIHSDPEVSVRLREMGFREDAIVRCITRNDNNLICEILNSRIGLNGSTANSIAVTALNSCKT